MDSKETIFVKVGIFPFFWFGFLFSIGSLLMLVLITNSFLYIIFAIFICLLMQYSSFKSNSKLMSIVIDNIKVEGAIRSSFFSITRGNISIEDVDLSLSKNRPLLKGSSYIASMKGTKIILDKKFLSEEQVTYIFEALKNKLTTPIHSDGNSAALHSRR
jgi:hypothetical protein